MNDDVGEETIFSVIFPLPFRVFFLTSLGILAWATNLHGLHILGIDAAAALDLSSYYHHSLHEDRRVYSSLPTTRSGWNFVPHPSAVYGPFYRMFFQHALVACIAWMLYRHASGGELALADVFKFIPAVTGLVLFMLLICPFNICEKRQREEFLNSIYRCIFSPTKHRIYFSDVVFADYFTSFAKVIGDVWLSICMLLPQGSLLIQPAQTGWSRWILPTFMSFPYAVRFRQCLIDYMSPTNESQRPLYNALKYASSFPVIYLSAAQRIVVSDVLAVRGQEAVNQAWHGEHQLFRLWLLAAAVNSLYSFWWDVTHDWGFDLLRPAMKGGIVRGRSRSPPKRLVLPHLHSRSNLLSNTSTTDVVDEMSKEEDLLEGESKPTHWHSSYLEHQRYPFGLRSTLLFPLPIYPFVIFADLVLRLIWSAKLSSHLHSHTDGDLIIFWIEMAEVVRRWMWLFLRVEWEVVRERQGYAHSHANSPHRPHQNAASSRAGEVVSIPDEGYEMIPSDSSENVSEGG